MSEPLTDEQVHARIAAWVAAGLPAGRIILCSDDRVMLEMPGPVEVHAWTEALGATPVILGRTYGAWPVPRAVALGGRDLDVYCILDGPLPEPGEQHVRIEVL